MGRTVIGTLIGVILLGTCCLLAPADDGEQRQLPEAVSKYIHSQPRANPPPDRFRQRFMEHIKQQHPPRSVPFKVPDGMEIPPGPPRDDRAPDDSEASGTSAAWKYFLIRLDTSLAAFVRQRVQIPERYLRALAQQPDTKLFSYAGSDSTWWWYNFTHNLPKEYTQDAIRRSGSPAQRRARTAQ